MRRFNANGLFFLGSNLSFYSMRTATARQRKNDFNPWIFFAAAVIGSLAVEKVQNDNKKCVELDRRIESENRRTVAILAKMARMQIAREAREAQLFQSAPKMTQDQENVKPVEQAAEAEHQRPR